MGREAQVRCTLGAHSEVVTAHLESRVLILRGAQIKRRFDLGRLQGAAVVGASLQFGVDGERVQLELGAAEAAKWLHKINTPPPSLAAKLGVSAEQPAWLLGPLDDAALQAALVGAQARSRADARLMVAVVMSDEALRQALLEHSHMSGLPLWLVYEKGSRAALGDSAIRKTLRAQAYMDSKTTAVSERLTATRYAQRTQRP